VAPLHLLNRCRYIEFLALTAESAGSGSPTPGAFRKKRRTWGFLYHAAPNNTERPITVSLGTNGGRPRRWILKNELKKVLTGKEERHYPPTLDGKAGERKLPKS